MGNPDSLYPQEVFKLTYPREELPKRRDQFWQIPQEKHHFQIPQGKLEIGFLPSFWGSEAAGGHAMPLCTSANPLEAALVPFVGLKGVNIALIIHWYIKYWGGVQAQISLAAHQKYIGEVRLHHTPKN